VKNITFSRRFFGWIFVIITTVATLSAGLQQRGSFSDNWISFNENTETTEIGSYGLAYGDFSEVYSDDKSIADQRLVFDFVTVPVEFTVPNFKVFTQIGPIGSDDPLIIGQWRTHLIILKGKDYANKLKRNRLQADMANYIGEELKVRVLLYENKYELYFNEQLVNAYSATHSLSVEADSTISIGNSHNGKHGWSGEVRDFAVSVAAAENLSDNIIRDYSFSAWTGKSIEDRSSSNSPLTIPKPGRFPEKTPLQIEGLDSLFAWNIRDLAINLLGFIPMGIAMAWVASQLPGIRSLRLGPTIFSIVLCASLSLLIELSQQYIPGRQSHLHDLILNICGGLLGVVFFNLLNYMWHSGYAASDQMPENVDRIKKPAK